MLLRVAGRRLALVLAVSLLLLAACGGDDDGSGGTATSEPDPSADAGAGEFPASVEHRYGTTELSEAPERIVTLGFSDQDAVLAFGVAPVAVTDWYGEYEHATWPWAQDELGDAEPVVLNQGAFTGMQDFDYETIAELEPDLIIGLYTGMTQEEYDTLSVIAPTVASSPDYPEYGMPWQETTRMVGQILGQAGRAEELIAEIDQQFADAAAAHPEFEGVEMVVAEQFEPGSSFARSATDPRTVFMTQLGFVLPADIAELAGDLDGAPISDELMTQLDRELLIWNVGHDDTLREQIEAKPLYDQLQVVQDGRVLFIEDPLVSGALTWSTVLSLPYALEELVPQLAEVVAG
ncbi:iron-siderophore ABC transporter substrate-binding protein [Jiangella rhizosphaerae]|uniref:Iron-siderophore ABC transporter substrate-binding protein n=1 Tax=Jiangella rhizosphaerae TaxID=2293569 RepID=A0A418KH22_9ACTN|nr:iron-siderophore ABC transporter substrate-binding protein [Jiangella rhizosphaerae]RIQ11393.1 iron-siderophore ABC transporter substrate-binding protein [Jiangella rhizosphaerae]